MTDSKLVTLAQEEQFDALDQAWQASLQDPGAIEDCCRTLQVLCERDMASRALPMAASMMDALASADRLGDAVDVGMTLVRLDAHNDGLAQQISSLIERQFASESWYDLIRQLSSLEQAVTGEALAEFERFRRYTTGHVIYHRAGWGAGLVEQFIPDRKELVIRFSSGRVQETPLTTALDSMQPLPADDLRSMMLVAADELAQMAAETPAVLIRKAVRICRGKATSSEVKSLLSPDVIPAKKWATFWKKAKAAAAVDPWLQVEGSTTRPVFHLRKKPLSLADEAERMLRHCDDLGQEVALIREYLERSPDPAAQQTILEIAEKRIDAAASGTTASHAHILDGILLLEKHDRHPSTTAASELKAMLVGEGEEFHPENFDMLATQDAREHAVGLIPDALGENWAERCIAKATRLPASVVELIVELLTEKGHAAQLLSTWDKVAPYPQRHPMLTYLLGRLSADGAFDGAENAPSRVTVSRVLLHLCRVLASKRKKSTQFSRLLSRTTSLLAGRRGFLEGALEETEKDDLAAFLGISERGGADFPQEISDLILKSVSKRFPELTAKPEKPFWEEDQIYITRKGLAVKREEHRKLVEELIPANSKAIGAAASLGDLSENSEWEAAIEEQRNLATRAGMIDEDLRKAKLLEDIEIPADVIAPGTQVSYTVVETGETHSVKILGPWDCTEEGIINYRAPFAQALLGLAPGDVTTLYGDGTEQEVRVSSIERIV